MPHNLLLLGGTTEATALAHLIAKTGMKATISYAGRVERIKPQPIPKRIGGFGGVEGLCDFLEKEKITHLIDATHPFAAQMSENAIAACQKTQTPLLALTRAPWHQQPDDKWHHVTDIASAVSFLDRPARRVMLAIGRMHLDSFTIHPQHHYLLRLVDEPEVAPQFPHCDIVVSRGPFTKRNDMALLSAHDIDLVIAKNAGGKGAYAKIEAARALGLEVVMIDRPYISPRDEVHSPEEVLSWLD